MSGVLAISPRWEPLRRETSLESEVRGGFAIASSSWQSVELVCPTGQGAGRRARSRAAS